MPAPFLSIIIPAFNEERRLPATLRRLSEFCAGLPFVAEVIVVVERSSDRTVEVARETAGEQGIFRVLPQADHRGKGRAVKIGMLEARGVLAVFTDADLSTPPEEILRFLDHMEDHPEIDVLIGDRKHPSSKVERQGPLRHRMGEVFNALVRGLTGLPFRDTQCGFKMFRAEAAQAIFSRLGTDGFAFDVEALLWAERLGLRVADLPVEWRDQPGSRLHVVRDSLRMAWDSFRLRARMGKRS